MILYPMVISAIAVLATLVYASYLDIKDRRVPFRTWYPMLGIGIICTGYLLWGNTGNASLIAGYLALIASFLYADYLDNRGSKDSLGLTVYYQESSIFYYLAVVLILPALSWFVLAKNVNLSLVPWYAMFAGIVAYVSYGEFKRTSEEKTTSKRQVTASNVEETLNRWYFVLIIVIFAITSVLMFFGVWGPAALSILLLAIFCGIFYVFGRMHLFGGADAWALIFISFCVPTFPIPPLLNSPPLGFLSFSVLINALLLNLAAPLGIFAINIIKGNRAPLMYMFFGFPVKGEKIQDSWGFVMEDFEEKEGSIDRRFIGFWDSIKRMYTGKGRMYTNDLRKNPQGFEKELAMYKKAGTVWISYAVPFIIPITAGLITAILCGDFLLAIMKIVMGGI